MKRFILISWYVIGLWTGFVLLDEFVINPSSRTEFGLPTTIAFAIIFATFVLWFLLGKLKKKISA